MRNIRRISKKYGLRQIVTFFLVCCMFCNPAVLAEVVSTGVEPGTGTVTVSPLGPGITTQNMTASDGVIGYFSDFDILAGHTVICDQSGATNNALFKVNSNNGTQIFGTFTSDGNIYLQDLRGILIGAEGQINTNEFIASTLNIKNSDWQAFITLANNQLKFERGVEDPTGDMENRGTINASKVYLIGSQVLNSGTIKAGENASDLLVMAAGEKVFLTHEDSKVLIKVPTDLMTPDPATNKVDIHTLSTINADQVVLAAGDVFTAALNVGSLAATANRDITLGDTVTTAGDITLTADFDGSGVGDVDAQVLTAGGTVDISASDTTINLHENVTADVDIVLNNNTVADAGIALTAGQNVDIAANKTLTANGNLTIEATGGEINAETSVIDMAADGQTLTLTQNASMDLEQDFSVDNRINTDLVADSISGSVTSDAAGEWNSITAEAADNITLSDISEVITTGALDAENGDVKVTSIDGKVEVRGAINAGQDVIITATDEGLDGTEDAIFLYGGVEVGRSIDAGGDIWLNNNTWAAGGYYLDALQDVRVGWQGNQDPWDPTDGYYAPKTLTGAGKVTIEAARHITLGGDVTANGDLHLLADYDKESAFEEFHDGVGNMTALGSLETTNSELGVVGKNIQIDGTVDIAGEIWMYAADNITLEDSVIADDDIIMYADWDPGVAWDYDDGVGTMWAKSTIDSTWGKIDLRASDTTIKLDDNVTAFDDILLRNNTVVAADKKLESIADDVVLAGGKTLTGQGALDIVAGEDIIIGVTNVDQHWDNPMAGSAGNVSAAGNMTMNAGGSIYAHGTLTTTHIGPDDGIGNIDLTASGGINLFDDVSADVTDDGDIILHNNTWAADDVTLKAGQDVTVGDGTGDGTSLTGEGALTIEADRHIILGGAVVASDDVDGDLVLWADKDDAGVPGGDMTAHGNIDNYGGSIDIYSSDSTTYLGGDHVIATGDITLHNNTELNGGTFQTIEATTGKLTTMGYVHKTSTGELDMFGGFDGPLGSGDYSVSTKEVKAEDGDLTITGNAFVLLDGDIYSKERMELTSNADGDEIGVDAGTLEHASGTIKSLNDDVDMAAINSRILLNGGVAYDPADSAATTYVSAGGDILLYSSTSIAPDRNLDAGDDVALAANKRIVSNGSLTIEAGDDILLGIDDVINHWSNQGSGSGGNVTVNGNLSLTAGDDIHAHGQLLTETDSAGNITATAVDDIHLYNTPTSADADGTLTLTADSDSTGDGDVTVDGALYGNMKISGVDVTVYGDVESDGALDIDADDDIELRAKVSSVGEMTMDAGDDIKLNADSGDTTSNSNMTLIAGKTNNWGDVEAWGTLITTDAENGDLIVSASDNIRLHHVETSADAAGELQLLADTDDDLDGGNVVVDGALYGNMKLSGVDVTVYGDVESDGILDVDADDDIMLKANISSVGEMTMDAGSDIELNRSSGNTSSKSTITLNAGDDVTIGKPFSGEGNVTANGKMDIFAGSDSDDSVKVFGKLTTTNGGNINVQAGDDIKLYGTFNGPEFESAQADGDLTLDAEDDLDVLGDLISNNGSIVLSSDNTTTYLGGDVIAAVDVTLNNNTVFDGGGYPDQVDQAVEAGGTITAKGWLKKVTSGDLWLLAGSDEEVTGDAINLEDLVSTHQGNLWIIAENGDIQLGGDVTTFGEGGCDRGIPCTGWPTGGVLIVSDDGKIYTRDGVDNDTLNVSITGNSDHWDGLGIGFEDTDSRLAIAIWSEEDLKIGTGTEGAELRAYGRYYDDVDDRSTLGFLDAPETIGGFPRDEGDPFDAAIYVGSNGDVDVSSPVSIISREPVEYPDDVDYQYESVQYDYECVPKGAMVIDAWNAVTFDGGVPGGMFETSLAYGDVGDRLEVVSRRSEWLFQTIGLLPYAEGGGPFPDDYAYVLRGAGLGNPLITDGRAWVLEDPILPPPLYQEAGEAAEDQDIAEGGCPPLMNWLANEIGVPAEDIQVALAGALALNTDIQPCEMCARLMEAAKRLEDTEGTQIAAMARVVNEFVTTPAPPSPEQMTQIAAAMAEHVGDGTYYAAAGIWIDALVVYVGIMNTEMGYSASDATAFAQKYLTPVTETGNVALNAYVQARLAALGG